MAKVQLRISRGVGKLNRPHLVHVLSESFSFPRLSRVFFLAGILVFSCLAHSTAAQLPTALGWTSLPANTALTASGACPPNNFEGDPFQFAELCKNVVNTWNGAIADTTANRLIIWGGGHVNYYGNEIYSLNLTANPVTVTRLKDPTIPTNFANNNTCVESIPPGSDTAPNSRESYGGLAFIPGPYRMLILDGSLACQAGNGSFSTWSISLNNLSNATSWVHETDSVTGPEPGSSDGGDPYGTISDYDSNSGLVFIMDSSAIFTYNYAANTYRMITPRNGFVTDVYMSGAIDPTRKLFVFVGHCINGSCAPGNGVFVADISDPTSTTQQNWTTATLADPNCAEFLNGGVNPLNSANPGIAFDSVAKDFVGWPNQGNSVYIMTPDTVNKRLTCQKLTFPNGPPNSAHAQNQPNSSFGTFGRFRYFPALDAFVVVNDGTLPAYILRLRSSTSPDFSLTATPGTATINPGGTARYTVKVAAVNGFSGVVNLAVPSGLPSGANATFSPASISGSGSSTLTVTTTTGTPTGSPTLTIRATSGSLTHATTVVLNVAASDFSITATPGTASVAPGGKATYTATVKAIGTFSGTVSFSAHGLPSGATASFSPTSVNGSGSSTLTVATTASTPTGSFTFAITGTSGSLIHSANVILAVTSTDPATIRFVQGNYSDPQSSTPSVRVTFTAAQAAGHLNVVVVAWFDSTTQVSSVTDSRGNTYIRAVGPTLVGGSQPAGQSIYYAKNIASSQANANTVIVTFNDAAFFPDVRILEYSGANTSGPVDAVAAGTGANSPANSGSATTSNANDLILGASAVWTSTTGPGTGFTARILTQPDHDIVEDEMVKATGHYSATAPLNNAGPWIMQLVAFKAQ